MAFSIAQILASITYDKENRKIISKTSGTSYEIDEFCKQIGAKCGLSQKQVRELRMEFTENCIPQSETSIKLEKLIDKYEFSFSDGVYFIKDKIISLEDIYRLMWREEKLMPNETIVFLENIEKISEQKDIQTELFGHIFQKQKEGKSKYLETLDIIYPDINFRQIMYNIIVPKTKPMFHIFYDDGVGGTGKSTFLEVLTKIVGEEYVSNVLLDQFGNRFIFANMLGKYLNIGDDNGKNDELQNVGTLKSIVTGNRVTIDRKNISPIEARIFAKQLFATNILPYLDFTDGGLMRRLNIVPMNKVIPKTIKLPEINEDEIGYILYEILDSKDLEKNNNDLAITTSPLYRFIENSKTKSYDSYQSFCSTNGFRCMNIINFEAKSKFIEAYNKTHKLKEDTDTGEQIPF